MNRPVYGDRTRALGATKLALRLRGRSFAGARNYYFEFIIGQYGQRRSALRLPAVTKTAYRLRSIT